MWAWMPPRPHLSDTAAHKGKQGWNCWGLNNRKNGFFFCQRHIKIQQAAESPWPCNARFLSLPFGPRAVQSGCGRQPAKSVWLPVASQTLCLPPSGEENFVLVETTLWCPSYLAFTGIRISHRNGVPPLKSALPPWAAAIWCTSFSPVPWPAPPSASN